MNAKKERANNDFFRRMDGKSNEINIKYHDEHIYILHKTVNFFSS